MPKLASKRITPASNRALNRLLDATKAYAFRGSAHPDVYDHIVLEYKQALQLMRNRIAKLETKEPK
jgi:hypothetical protein